MHKPHAAMADLPRPILLNVGRVAVEKNLEAFLDLEFPGSKVVVGDGPDRARLEMEYPEAIFLGSLSGEELASAYCAADCFVFPLVPTMSSGPATGYAATGRPQASASITTSPKVSVRLGKTKQSAAQ